jgi:PAS domain S-box-containing protein
MVITQVGLVILTAIAIGLPAVWLLRDRLERHARQTLVQGSRTALALISEKRHTLDQLALLTAQRPTLQQLLKQGTGAELVAYLQTLQGGAGLDLVLLCGADGTPLLPVEAPHQELVCGSPHRQGLFLAAGDSQMEGWLLAARSVPEAEQETWVVVGARLDEVYAASLRDQSGLEVALFSGSQLLATSLPGVLDLARSGELLRAGPAQGTPVEIDGRRYYRLQTGDEASGLELLFFYSVAELVEAQRALTWQAGLGISLVVILGSVLGIWRARQISQPLARLHSAAERLRMGDLSTPVALRTPLHEISRVAQALEEARRALQHSLQQLRKEKVWIEHLLEAVVEGILTIDRRGRITFFSSGAERISGWPAGQALGRSPDEVFQLAAEQARFSQFIPPPGGRQKAVIRLADGRQLTLAISGARLAPPEAGKAAAVLVLRDISDEEAIRRLLGEFLANVSHEFRTPLSALAASIELLLGQLPELTPGELRELLNSIHLGTLSLQTLIDNLLEGASIETGRFRVYPRAAELGEIARQAVHTMQPLAEKYGVTLALDLPEQLPPVRADPRRTGQVLVNLFSNAIKWSPSGSRVALTAVQQDGQIRVCVIDQGPGIPPERLTDLFVRFDQMQAPGERGAAGAGLGLSVVKAIIEAQGGQVGAHNQAEGGAAFWFTLPVLPPGGESAPVAGAEEAEPA